MTTKEQAIEFLQRKMSKDPYSADIYRMAIEALTEKWISMDEKLPEVDKYGDVNVLVCMDDGFIASATYDKNNGCELWAESGEVTHWMPLPELPKERIVENEID